MKQIIIGLVAAASMSTLAFGATTTPRHHHRPHVTHAQAATVDREAPQDPKFSGMTAKIERPNAEWDCGGGDAGCSWEPSGWR